MTKKSLLKEIKVLTAVLKVNSDKDGYLPTPTNKVINERITMLVEKLKKFD